MACGNEGDEGESGKTFNSVKIAAYSTGYDSGSFTKTSVTERNIEDFELSLVLESDYPLGEGCLLKIQWSTDFIASYITINDEFCASMGTSDTS